MSAGKKSENQSSPRKGLQLTRNPEFSDLTIECQGRTFPAHKLIVCSQSDVIKLALGGTRFKESDTGTFNLDLFDPDIVHHMLEFLYTTDYPVYRGDDDDECLMKAESDDEENGTSLLQKYHPETMFHVEIACIADFLNVTALFYEAQKRVRQRMNLTRDPAGFKAIVYHLADAGVFGKFEHMVLSKIPSGIQQLQTFIQHDDHEALNLPHTFRVQFVKRLLVNAKAHQAEIDRLKYENERFLDGTLKIIKRRKLCPSCIKSSELIQEELTRGVRVLYCRHCHVEV